MEIFGIIKVNPCPYVKQTDEWGQYLEKLGWKYYRTKQGVGVAVLKTILGQLCKVQRPNNFNEETANEIDEICKKNKVILAKVELNIGQSDSSLRDLGFIDSDWPISPPTSLYFNLELSEQELWGRLSKSGKYGVSRARREGIKVSVFRNPDEDILRSYIPVLRYTERKHHFLSQSDKELRILRDIFKENCFIALSYNNQGDITGGKFFLGYGSSVIYLNGGTSETGSRDKSGFSLYWEPLVYFKNLGYKLMDLEGTFDPRYVEFTKKWKGFSEFKMKFGPERLEFPGVLMKKYALIFKILPFKL